MQALWRDERGQVLPFVALSAMALILATGVVLVAGLGYAYAELVQQAADAAALAGASTADVMLWFENPVTGACDSPAPAALDARPCRVEVYIDEDQARQEARRTVQLNASAARFAHRGLQVARVDAWVLDNHSESARVRVHVEAEARVPLLGLFGMDRLVIRREADSRVSVDCGGPC